MMMIIKSWKWSSQCENLQQEARGRWGGSAAAASSAQNHHHHHNHNHDDHTADICWSSLQTSFGRPPTIPLPFPKTMMVMCMMMLRIRMILLLMLIILWNSFLHPVQCKKTIFNRLVRSFDHCTAVSHCHVAVLLLIINIIMLGKNILNMLHCIFGEIHCQLNWIEIDDNKFTLEGSPKSSRLSPNHSHSRNQLFPSKTN